MENNLETLLSTPNTVLRSDDTQDGAAMRHHDTYVFSETFDEKETILRVNRWEKDALVVDSADYDMVQSL